ncbi:MAG: DUF4080 domain-containing protein [Alistipes senegalensis]|nr:DUF4080 domain-containing protein [Oxalobacter formigenes]MCM1280665.1 DUF4080 domain-containing protein [Alistipes senegalensis]
MTILLATFNARYAHSSLGLRYLHANMGAYASRTRILEMTTGISAIAAAEKILSFSPSIICLGVYIWNVETISRLVPLLKALSPETPVILGGPEISHETASRPLAQTADYIITGWGEATLPELCAQILHGRPPAGKIHTGKRLAMENIAMPYHLYSDEDIAHRTLYVEASRGCPFRCEFCLSSLDKTAWAFDTERFLAEMEKLYRRGARSFKFVDRTFNLNTATCLKILHFFLDKIHSNPAGPVFVHFEVIPDRLPDALKTALQQFPAGTLQMEIGIQTFNPEVQSLISRKQDNAKSETNIRWLRTHTQAHLHTDLIMGLPGETLESFASGFNRLVHMQPHEIQVGLLKRLRGTPILRHTESFKLVFDPSPPYSILSTADIDFFTMQRMTRFARFWDLVANSGRFGKTLPLILGNNPFERFMALSDWLYETGKTTYGIALDRLAAKITEWLILQGEPAEQVRIMIGQDYAGKIRKQEELSAPGSGKPGQAHVRQSRHMAQAAAPDNASKIS